METIPHEVFLNILDFVGQKPKELLPYVSVSRRWQRAIEPHFFRSFRTKHTDLTAFAALFRQSEAHRKALVKEIYFDVVLPKYDGQSSEKHAERSDQRFSAAVLKLFRILETFNGDRSVEDRGGIHLTFRDIYVPDEQTPMGGLLGGLMSHAQTSPRPKGTFIRFTKHEELPTLTCVSRFQFGSSANSRTLDPASMVMLAHKLQSLKICRVDYCNPREDLDTEAQRTMRLEFTNALSTYPHSSLEQLLIDFRPTSPLDEASAPPNLVAPDTSVDSFNLVLHKLMQKANLEYVSFSAQHVISPEFFWPYNDAEKLPTDSRFWSHLKTIRIIPSTVTPNGNWYFTADPSIATHDEFTGAGVQEAASKSQDSKETINTFRSIPNPETMNPLLIAMAKVIRHAPSLEEISLQWGSIRLKPKFLQKEKEVKREFNIFYYAKGINPGHQVPGSSDTARLIFQARNWRPDQDVENHLRDALGSDGVVIYQ